ncbi:hypothetical protein XM38_040600 [Halomicronema hongdechloris C2206]|uniref:Uncharacterized protein n=1 Tax=Halomicronema hongdechloris C2206 TaxID=1641165 RepID=A0A1Z3HS27_9CYAN|nr:hypothetical protein XM38_040600 [Halomicronema hongdechloris C2206]
MSSDNLIAFQSPETTETFHDALSDLIGNGARQLIAQAVEAESQEFLASMPTVGMSRVVRQSCAMATYRSARSRPVLETWR